MGLYVGVDVGGTKVLAGEVADDGRVVRTATRRTPGRRVAVDVVEDALTSAIEEVAAGRRIDGVGLAAAGFVDREGERVVFAPHLPWAGEPVRDRLSERWAAPVTLANDADCAALAEARLGAARDVASAVVLTVGTGLGGALVLGGEVWRGAHGFAGEYGHQRLVPDGRPCECGGVGCWEQYASGNALLRAAREQVGAGPSLLSQLCGGDPAALTGPLVTEAAEAGDLAARAAFATVGEWLGVGLAGLVAALDPAVVVLGGGVSDAGERLLAPARAALEGTLVGAAHRRVPPLVVAAFGARAGLVGAGLLARD